MQALALLTAHIPNRGEQMVRYYGFYANQSRGLRKKLLLDSGRRAGTDAVVPALIESEVSSKEFRKSWARLIQKIYNVNPLVCSNIFTRASSDQRSSFLKIINDLNIYSKREKKPKAIKGLDGVYSLRRLPEF